MLEVTHGLKPGMVISLHPKLVIWKVQLYLQMLAKNMHYLYQNHHIETANSVAIVEMNVVLPYHLHSINLQVPEEILELYNIYM